MKNVIVQHIICFSSANLKMKRCCLTPGNLLHRKESWEQPFQMCKNEVLVRIYCKKLIDSLLSDKRDCYKSCLPFFGLQSTQTRSPLDEIKPIEHLGTYTSTTTGHTIYRTSLKLIQNQFSWNTYCGHWILSAAFFNLQSNSHCVAQHRYSQSCNGTQGACRRGDHSCGKWYPNWFSILSFWRVEIPWERCPK